MMETGTEPRILIAGDDELLADLVEARLRIEGMSPTTCTSGREALAILASEQFDAVILDVMLEDTDRDQLISKIRAKAATNGLPVAHLLRLA
jgi:DNA-binding response OmpR family regulator